MMRSSLPVHAARKRQTSVLHQGHSTLCLGFEFSGIRHALNILTLLFIITQKTNDWERRKGYRDFIDTVYRPLEYLNFQIPNSFFTLVFLKKNLFY